MSTVTSQNKLMFIINNQTNELVLDAAYKAAVEKKRELEDSSGEQKTHELIPGKLWIERVNMSPNWRARIKFASGQDYKRVTTKKADFEEAKRAAHDIYEKIMQQYRDGNLDGKSIASWQRVCRETYEPLFEEGKKLIKQGKKDNEPQKQSSIIKNHLKYFPLYAGKRIDQIDYAALCDFVDYEAHQDKAPSSANQWMMAIKKVFDHALKAGYIKNHQYPAKWPQFSKRDEYSYPPFEVDDRDALFSNFENFLENTKNQVARLYRIQLPMYFQLISSTGLRTGQEPLNILWSHIQVKKIEINGASKEYFACDVVAGKMAKTTKSHGKGNAKHEKFSRTILLYPQSVDALEQQYYIRYGERKGIRDIVKEGRHEPIFVGNKGVIPPFNQTFKQYCDYLFNSGRLSQTYTLYSCRAEFINYQIENGQAKGDIAQQCGNSVRVIEKYYEKYRLANRAARLLSKEDLAIFNPTPELLKLEAENSLL